MRGAICAASASVMAWPTRPMPAAPRAACEDTSTPAFGALARRPAAADPTVARMAAARADLRGKVTGT